MTWREYHEATKHTVQSLRRTQHFLDWKNMPEPFRHYEGVPVLDLPADPPGLNVPALELLQGAYGSTSAANGGVPFKTAVSFRRNQRVQEGSTTGYRYGLRVNPSSGNLHPTEFHFLTLSQLSAERGRAALKTKNVNSYYRPLFQLPRN